MASVVHVITGPMVSFSMLRFAANSFSRFSRPAATSRKQWLTPRCSLTKACLCPEMHRTSVFAEYFECLYTIDSGSQNGCTALCLSTLEFDRQEDMTWLMSVGHFTNLVRSQQLTASHSLAEVKAIL